MLSVRKAERICAELNQRASDKLGDGSIGGNGPEYFAGVTFAGTEATLSVAVEGGGLYCSETWGSDDGEFNVERARRAIVAYAKELLAAFANPGESPHDVLARFSNIGDATIGFAEFPGIDRAAVLDAWAAMQAAGLAEAERTEGKRRLAILDDLQLEKLLTHGLYCVGGCVIVLDNEALQLTPYGFADDDGERPPTRSEVLTAEVSRLKARIAELEGRPAVLPGNTIGYTEPLTPEQQAEAARFIEQHEGPNDIRIEDSQIQR
jgi:hypothetical protein